MKLIYPFTRLFAGRNSRSRAAFDRISLLLLILPALPILTSCSDDSRATTGNAPGDIVLLQPNPTAVVSVDTEPATRATITRVISPFPKGSQLGICIVPQGTDFDNDPIMPLYEFPGYDNMLVFGPTGTNDPEYITNWYYRPQGVTTAYTTNLFGIKSDIVIDLYGYYPYANTNAKQTTAIPFELKCDASNVDYMFTGKIEVDPVTPAINGSTVTLDANGRIPLPMQFRHAMTLLEFRLTTSLPGPLVIDTIKISAKDDSNTAAAVFGTKGTFNGITGAVTCTEYRSELIFVYKKTVPYNKTIITAPTDPRNYTSCYMAIPEIDLTAVPAPGYSGLKLTVHLAFDESPGADTGRELYSGSTQTFNLSDVPATGSGKQGFIKAHRYLFNVTVDNFIKYSGYPSISTDWTEETVPEIKL
jgi:hypothetical protein